jgi:Smg protein
MFDVLVYLYENYWRPDACPEHDQLTRKLSSVGFESDEIEEALSWLDGVAAVARSHVGRQGAQSVRVYTPVEQEHLGDASIGFISFLESAGVLPPPMREMVIDRASAIPGGPLDLEDLKIIVLMVFGSLGEEPDALILAELSVAAEDRLIPSRRCHRPTRRVGRRPAVFVPSGLKFPLRRPPAAGVSDNAPSPARFDPASGEVSAQERALACELRRTR